MKQSGKAEIGSNTTSLEDINNEIRVENLGRIYINSINKENEVMLNIELEERKLALLERQYLFVIIIEFVNHRNISCYWSVY
ncbi:hypothetical protein RclHR1_02800011 [Rhizophagus clarus]|uniref:Uncharacterized protein n=1 Tax=Rhizophagus clarus TaxID=94130 RepID=A0A2Z6RIN8_9GLOM|nr:hypothetical protein RclHR1_02800011 [Rhizophagus clarus]